jgi:hypothetical protein
MDQKTTGLYGKFHVSRVDGRDQPGGDKENARYFVLDYVNDPYAKYALMRYASACTPEYPELAEDLWIELGEVNRAEREKLEKTS